MHSLKMANAYSLGTLLASTVTWGQHKELLCSRVTGASGKGSCTLNRAWCWCALLHAQTREACIALKYLTQDASSHAWLHYRHPKDISSACSCSVPYTLKEAVPQ